MRVLLLLAGDRKELKEFWGAAAGGGSTAGCAAAAEAPASASAFVLPSAPRANFKTTKQRHLGVSLCPMANARLTGVSSGSAITILSMAKVSDATLRPAALSSCMQHSKTNDVGAAPAAASGSLMSTPALVSVLACEPVPTPSAACVPASSDLMSAAAPRRGSAAIAGVPAPAQCQWLFGPHRACLDAC